MDSCTVEINFLAMDKTFCPGQIIFVTDNIFLPETKFILSRTKHILSEQKAQALVSKNLLALNSVRLESSKKVLLVHVPQEAAN